MMPRLPLLVLVLCLVLTACQRQRDEHLIFLPDDRSSQVVEMSLHETPEEGGDGLFGPPAPEVAFVLEQLREVAERDPIRGLFLRLSAMGAAWGRAADVAAALEKVREAGKPVHCHADMLDNVATYIALRGCDRVTVTPAGMVDLVGPAAHVFYAKDLLDRIGVEAQLVQVGRYKGAADPLTRNDMPQETAETLGAILDGLHGALVTTLTERRSIGSAEARKLVDDGPHTPEDARRLGIIDHVAFDDEAREHARRAAQVDKVHRVSVRPRRERMGLRDLLRALAGDPPTRRPEGVRVGLVVLEGTIMDAEREAMGGIRSGPVVRALRRMADDPDVRAVVLRINSPGGSALASDRIWHAVRRLARRKPVIATLGDMAASGGYYVASAAHEILAHDASLVGSIGVVGGKVVVADLAERLGLNVAVLERGERAAWMSPFTPMDEPERASLERHLQVTYDRFLRRVAAGRGMELERVRAAAEGRLYLGSRARELGLVDAAGGLADALARARERGELPPDAPVERWPAAKTFFDALAGAVGGEREERARALLEGAGVLGDDLREVAWLSAIVARERVAVALPFVVRVQ
jgi:protease IV